MNLDELRSACAAHLPQVLRWAGGVAQVLRGFDIGVSGKESGSSNTDALTLADLSVQELLVGALRDLDPVFRECRIEAEEKTGDLGRFASEAEYTLALDPIDGTKQYRDRSGDGWAVMAHLRDVQTVHYSLVFVPETGPHGTWVEVNGDAVRCGEDDPERPARVVLDGLAPVDAAGPGESKKYYVIGFQQRDAEVAHERLRAIGLEGHTSDELGGSIFPLMARGEYAGSLIHSPNVYDFPVSLHIARAFGGDAVFVDDGRPVDFSRTWVDERADMLRLPGIAACSVDDAGREALRELAREWSPERYGPEWV